MLTVATCKSPERTLVLAVKSMERKSFYSRPRQIPIPTQRLHICQPLWCRDAQKCTRDFFWCLSCDRASMETQCCGVISAGHNTPRGSASLPLLDQNLTPCAGQMRALQLCAGGQINAKKVPRFTHFEVIILALCLPPPAKTDALFDLPHL